MKKVLLLFTLAFGVNALSYAQEMADELIHVGTYETNIFDEGAAEIAGYDPGTFRVFFTNAEENALKVIDIANPESPTLVQTIDLSPYGAGVNSVDVMNGLVAVAVENADVATPGEVVFFNVDGVFQAQFTVGVLPDMVTFTPDGNKVVVANEGEPNDSYSVDPNGAISIIDLTSGIENATVNTLDFSSYNEALVSLKNKGVRIFGPNAAVASDLEPEYISVTPDNSIAYVALQENNAVAVIDLNAASILDILPLGVKDHLKGSPRVKNFTLNTLAENWPELGTPGYGGGQDPVFLGGFSGLYFDANESTETSLTFYTIPDRGPNDAAVSKDSIDQEGLPVNIRPFKLPDYESRIVKFVVNPNSGDVRLEEPIFLTRNDYNLEDSTIRGVIPITGKGNVIAFDEVPVTYTDPNTPYTKSDYTFGDLKFAELPYDPYGGDFEGIVRDRDGNFWLCDEYRPSLYKFDTTGFLIDRYVPDGTSNLGVIPLDLDFYGKETLPRAYVNRRTNRGFEAIAYDSESHVIYAFIQSPLYNPDNSTRNQSDIIRILGVDANNGVPVEEYVYLLERNQLDGYSLARTDKIGDAVYLGNGRFLVIERDSSVPKDGNIGHKYIYEIDLKGATNIIDLPIASKFFSDDPEDLTLEQLTGDELMEMGITPVYKQKMMNLPSIGYHPSDKVEGIAQLPSGDIAVLNDNDFGIAGAGITDDNVLGIISFNEDYGFDATDEDEMINIGPRPTFGMFLPDAIAAFQVDGATYFATANEGDSREYEDEAGKGYVEEDRVGDVLLDETVFPNAAALQDDFNLGRLKLTTANGDLDNDGAFERIFSFGARSFSIFDQFGNLVYDSGDDFEQITAAEAPTTFNSNNDDNDSLDSRSDDKGPEPEAIEIATIGERTIALIGLERVGGIMMYDISVPSAPVFLQYINNRDFSVPAGSLGGGDLGVEDITFIPAEQSPNSSPLVITANEVSGTVSIFMLDIMTDVEDALSNKSNLQVFPNPVIEQLSTNRISDFRLFNSVGQYVGEYFDVQSINTAPLSPGVYILMDLKNHELVKFTKQ